MSKKNKFNIKTEFIKEFVKFCEELDKYPEQDKKLEKLDEFIKHSLEVEPMILIISYFLSNILGIGTPSNYYFMILAQTESKDFDKLNLKQLEYASRRINQYKEVEESVIEWVYSFEDIYVQKFLMSYLNVRNITGILAKLLDQVYAKYNLSKYLEDISLQDFSYEMVTYTKPKSRQRALKAPAILFRLDNPNLVYFYKKDDEIKSNMPNLNDWKGVFSKYKHLALIGSLTNDKESVLELFIATVKPKVVLGLMKDTFTLQNSYRYLNEAFNRVKNSMKLWQDYTSLPKLKKANGAMLWNLYDAIEDLSERPSGIVLFRNDVIQLDKIVVSKLVVEKLDFVKGKVSLQNVLTKSCEDVKISEILTSSVEESLAIGDKVSSVKFDKYRYLIK